ncbi:MAG: ribosome silencing factor [Bacteroidota bacterium]
MAKKEKKSTDITSSTSLSNIIVKGMQEKKGSDIVVMDLRKVKNAFTDYFVICSGTSDTQIDAIGDSIDFEVHKTLNQNPYHKEGKENKEWILLDYIDVVAHVFKKEKRDFFRLEELWGDAEITYLPN